MRDVTRVSLSLGTSHYQLGPVLGVSSTFVHMHDNRFVSEFISCTG